VKKNMKKIYTILAVLCVTVMSGCFSPWTGGHGTITIGFGDAVAFGARSAVLPGEIPYLVHAVTLTGPGGQTVHYAIVGGTTANISVPAGIWHIRVRADGTQGLRALGFGQVEVTAGQTAAAVITMSSAAEVSNHAQLAAAINNARTDGLEKIILVTQNIYAAAAFTIAPGRNITFASETDVAIRRAATPFPLTMRYSSRRGNVQLWQGGTSGFCFCLRTDGTAAAKCTQICTFFLGVCSFSWG